MNEATPASASENYDQIVSSLTTQMYLLAILLPPVAVLLCGKPVQALINLGLCLLLWVPAIVHAFAVVGNANAEKRQNRLIKALKQRDM